MGHQVHSRKQRFKVPCDHLFKRHAPPDEVGCFTVFPVRHRYKTGQAVWDLDSCKALDLGFGIFNDHGKIEAEVRHLRKRMAGIHRQRGQDGKNFPIKVGGYFRGQSL